MRRLVIVLASIAGAAAASVLLWMRDPRIGTQFVNEVVDPYLVRRGLSGAGRSELGTLEHVGRHSGTRRLSPVHPVATADGFRIVVPLGPRSEWARNVIASGHCRLQLHDVIHELDEPVLLGAAQMPELPARVRWLADRLGWQYLLLHRFAQHPGSLTDASAGEAAGVAAPPVDEARAPAHPV
jgi:hypothetical protein